MKQIYKVLLMTLLMCNFFTQGKSYTVTQLSEQNLSLGVGEAKEFTYLSTTTYHNIEWEVIGDAVMIIEPAQMTLGEDLGALPNGGMSYDSYRMAVARPYFYGMKTGKCTVIAKCYTNSQGTIFPYTYLTSIKILKINITVTGTDPTSMVMQHHLHLGIGQTHTLSPRLLPSGTSSTLTWYSSNTNVATVSGGKITAVAVGDATITCITANGLREDCEVTVTPTMVSNLSLNQDQLQMSVGDTYQFSTAIAPENASYKQVTWTSMNPDVVSIDNNGLMSCLSNGWSVILATTADGSNLTAGCFVQVGASEGGDVNGDGYINIKDVTELIDKLLRGVNNVGGSSGHEGSLDDLIS